MLKSHGRLYLLRWMISAPNPAKVNAVMQAMMKMVKLDIAKLKEAYESV